MGKDEKLLGQKLRILVPTNFSGHGITAAEYAIELFKGVPGEYILENVFQVPKLSTGTLISIHDIIAKEVNEMLRKESEKLKSKYSNLNITTLAREGNAISIIRNTVKRKEIDLTVIGHNSHVKSFFTAFLEQADCWPILLVPHPPVPGITEDTIIVSVAADGTSAGTPCFIRHNKLIEKKLKPIYFTKNDGGGKLRAEINNLLEKHKIGLIIFNVARRSELEQIIEGHNLDDILLSLPCLLISCNER